MSKDTITFYRVVAMPVDIAAARKHYNNPEIDYTAEERRKWLEIVDLMEAQELGEVIERYKALSREEREYARIDIYEVIEQLGIWNEDIYLERPITGVRFTSA